MPRLVPNPIGDLMHPLQRIEEAIVALTKKLRPVDSLPDVHEELLAVNRQLALVHQEIAGLRADLAGSAQPAAAPAAKRAASR